MKKFNVLLSVAMLLSLVSVAKCEEVTKDLHSATATDAIASVCEKNANFDSFVVKYSEDKKFVGILSVNKDGKGYKIQVFDISSQKCVFNFIESSAQIKDFEFKDDVVVLKYADYIGSKKAFKLIPCKKCGKGCGKVAWKNTLFGILPTK